MAMGINVTKIFLITFMIGTFVLRRCIPRPDYFSSAGYWRRSDCAGVRRGRDRGHGFDPQALIGAIVVGLSRAAAVHLYPELELFVIYAIMALVLIFRPERSVRSNPVRGRYDAFVR